MTACSCWLKAPQVVVAFFVYQERSGAVVTPELASYIQILHLMRFDPIKAIFHMLYFEQLLMLTILMHLL